MKALRGTLALGLVMESALAIAGDPGGHVDVYFVPDTKLKIAVPGVDNKLQSDGGRALGLRGGLFIAPQIFVDGEYQAGSYDGIDGDNMGFDIDWLRAGIGHSTPMNLYVLGQFVRVEGDSAETGFGLQLGYHTDPGNAWELRGQVGYLDLGDTGDGFELLVGGAFELTKPVRFFVDYRVTTLEEDVKAQFFDVLAGVRLRFQGSGD